MENNEIQNQIETIVREKFRYHVCSISYSQNYKLGTGSLISHNDQLYILTCHHIATEACKHKNLEICFSNNTIISHGQISLFRKCKKDDIALLKLKTDLKLSGLNPLSLQDFVNANDLRIFSQSNNLSFTVIGFPSEIAMIEPAKKMIRLKPLFFLTTPMQPKQQTKTKIYLDYSFKNQDSSDLPKASGLSGAGIWFVPPFDSPENSNKTIWSSTQFKFIAVQYAWKQGEYIVGTRLKKLFEWLK